MGRLILAGLILMSVVGMAYVLPNTLSDRALPKADFAYGARLDLDGQQVDPSINAAVGMGMDWIALDFDWAAWMPDANHLPDLSRLEAAMEVARQNKLRVMISLTHTPAWAVTPAGPDARSTASLVISLARLYAGTLEAVELYPAVNTLAGWEAYPNPAAYAAMLQTVHNALQSNGLRVTLVTSLAPAQQPGDLDDRAYLDELYKYGAGDWMPVVGLRLPNLSGEPKVDPSGGEGIVLRHFELLRQVMVANQHSSGRMWITGFSWPTEAAYAETARQAKWVNRAYKMLRSQIYIGAAFFQQLNPPASGFDPATGFIASLILPDGRLHPACEPLSQLTALDGNVQKTNFQSPVSKKDPSKATIKP